MSRYEARVMAKQQEQEPQTLNRLRRIESILFHAYSHPSMFDWDKEIEAAHLAVLQMIDQPSTVVPGIGALLRQIGEAMQGKVLQGQALVDAARAEFAEPTPKPAKAKPAIAIDLAAVAAGDEQLGLFGGAA